MADANSAPANAAAAATAGRESSSAAAAVRRIVQLSKHIAPAGVGGLLPDVDPDGLREYSVVYTDRTLNHMSAKFQGVM